MLNTITVKHYHVSIITVNMLACLTDPLAWLHTFSLVNMMDESVSDGKLSPDKGTRTKVIGS